MVAYKKYIDAEPKIMLGKPKIKGTRITVELILRKYRMDTPRKKSWKCTPTW